MSSMLTFIDGTRQRLPTSAFLGSELATAQINCVNGLHRTLRFERSLLLSRLDHLLNQIVSELADLKKATKPTCCLGNRRKPCQQGPYRAEDIRLPSEALGPRESGRHHASTRCRYPSQRWNNSSPTTWAKCLVGLLHIFHRFPAN